MSKQVIRIEWDRPEGRLRMVDFTVPDQGGYCELWAVREQNQMPISTRILLNQQLATDLIVISLNAALLFKEINA
jgi:hypothetical protein